MHFSSLLKYQLNVPPRTVTAAMYVTHLEIQLIKSSLNHGFQPNIIQGVDQQLENTYRVPPGILHDSPHYPEVCCCYLTVFFSDLYTTLLSLSPLEDGVQSCRLHSNIMPLDTRSWDIFPRYSDAPIGKTPTCFLYQAAGRKKSSHQ